MSSAGEKLTFLLERAGLPALEPRITEQFEKYMALLQRWNTRTNLTSIRDEDGILERHFVESIACATALSAGIRTLLDFGSGAGFPGIPIALCRPAVHVTLAESQNKKAAFLQEAVRTLGIDAQVHAGRAETLDMRFDCVTLRAVDKMDAAIPSAAELVAPGGWLALLTTNETLETLEAAAGPEFTWREPVRLPGAECRVLALGRRVNSPA